MKDFNIGGVFGRSSCHGLHRVRSSSRPWRRRLRLHPDGGGQQVQARARAAERHRRHRQLSQVRHQLSDSRAGVTFPGSKRSSISGPKFFLLVQNATKWDHLELTEIHIQKLLRKSRIHTFSFETVV